MPAITFRMYAARNSSLWEATSASAGASRRVGANSLDRRMTRKDTGSTFRPWRRPELEAPSSGRQEPGHGELVVGAGGEAVRHDLPILEPEAPELRAGETRVDHPVRAERRVAASVRLHPEHFGRLPVRPRVAGHHDLAVFLHDHGQDRVEGTAHVDQHDAVPTPERRIR